MPYPAISLGLKVEFDTFGVRERGMEVTAGGIQGPWKAMRPYPRVWDGWQCCGAGKEYKFNLIYDPEPSIACARMR